MDGSSGQEEREILHEVFEVLLETKEIMEGRGSHFQQKLKMDISTTFLELPLDRELYTPKTFVQEKPPLRVLLPEASSKIALNLMYKIGSGQVFGPDQKIILHLINTKGSVVQQRAFMLELEDCGFEAIAEMVVSAEPDISYRNVDYVISIAGFEEQAGHPLCNSFLYQLNKSRNVARNIREFGKPDTKLIICGPSTKGVTVLLTCLRVFEPDIRRQNITGVTCLDVEISKCYLAKQLKTTTDKIKNIVIWGVTFPDLANATVLGYLPEDVSHFEEVEQKVVDALKDHHWIYNTFIPAIYKRVLRGHLAKHGMAVAWATAKHVKALIRGTDTEDEIMSMAAIVPAQEPYGVPNEMGFSLPVSAKDGFIEIREDVLYQSSTRLMMHKIIRKLQTDMSMVTVYNMVKYMKEYEQKTGEQFLWTEHVNLIKKDSYSPQLLTYLISPKAEEQPPPERLNSRRKSIIWEDVHEDLIATHEILTKVNFRKKSRKKSSLTSNN